MKPIYCYALSVAVAAGITLSNLKPAYGELVFEDDMKTAPAAQTQSPAEAPAGAVRGDGDLTQAETMRRQRLRVELKNEDRLTQKLEELRLKDEMKRTTELMGSGIAKEEKPIEPLQEQRVGTAVAAPAAATGGAAPSATPAQSAAAVAVGINGAPIEGIATNQSVAKSEAGEEDADAQRRVSITPRAGTGSITNSIYNVSAKFAAGIGISVDMTDYIGFTAGYTYATYSIGAGNALNYSGGPQTSYLQSINMNDNVIDLGARGYFMGPSSRVRPFIGAGGAYRKGFVNYDNTTQNYLKQINPSAAQDVDVSGFAGYIEAGLEFKLSKMLSLVGSFRYFDVLSSSQNNPLNPNAFLNPNGVNAYGGGLGGMYYGGLGASPYGVNYAPDTRSAASTALASQNFYQIMAGVSFSF